MKKAIIFLLLCIMIIPLVHTLALNKLEPNIITNIDADDILDSDGNSKISSVVVGYDSAVTDYLAGAELAIYLTSINKGGIQFQLFCSSEPIAIYPPIESQVFLRTNVDIQTSARILIAIPSSQIESIPRSWRR